MAAAYERYPAPRAAYAEADARRETLACSALSLSIYSY